MTANVEVVFGRALVLTVRVNFNYSLNSLMWEYQNKILHITDERVTINHTVSLPVNSNGSIFSTLQITSVTHKDAGEYSAIATNIDGRRFISYNVIVLGKVK